MPKRLKYIPHIGFILNYIADDPDSRKLKSLIMIHFSGADNLIPHFQARLTVSSKVISRAGCFCSRRPNLNQL